MNVNLSITHLAQLTGIVTGTAARRSATKEAAAKKFVTAFSERVGEGLASLSKRDILKTNDFSLAKMIVEGAIREADGGKLARKTDKPTAKSKPAKAETAPREAPKAKPATRERSKRDIMLDLVCRKGGATEAEICEQIGWKKCLVTLRRAAAAEAVTLHSEKVKGGRARYFGQRAT